jgi:integrase
MPRKAKLDPHKAARKAHAAPVKEIRQTLVNRAVQVQSLKQYLARYQRMEIFRSAMKRDEWSVDLFTRWLGQMLEAGYKDAEGYRAALAHCLAAEGRPVECLKDPTIIKMTQGFGLQNKLARVPMGTISLHMMEELCQWLRRAGEWKLAVLSAVLFHSQARGEEIMRMRIGDIQKDGESRGWVLWHVRNDKRCKRGNAFGKTTEKVILLEVLTLVEAISKDRKRGELVFQKERGFCLKALARKIKEATKALRWPTDVRFTGPHGIRHGGTRPLMERAKVAVATGLANQSKGTMTHYAKRKK